MSKGVKWIQYNNHKITYQSSIMNKWKVGIPSSFIRGRKGNITRVNNVCRLNKPLFTGETYNKEYQPIKKSKNPFI